MKNVVFHLQLWKVERGFDFTLFNGKTDFVVLFSPGLMYVY